MDTLSNVDDLKKDNSDVVASRRISMGLDHRHVQASKLPEASEGMVGVIDEESVAAKDHDIPLGSVTEQETGVSPFPGYLLSTTGA